MNRTEMLAALDALSIVVEDASSMSYERNPQDYSQFGEPNCYIDARKALAALRASAAPEEGSVAAWQWRTRASTRDMWSSWHEGRAPRTGWYTEERPLYTAFPSDSGKAAPVAWVCPKCGTRGTTDGRSSSVSSADRKA